MVTILLKKKSFATIDLIDFSEKNFILVFSFYKIIYNKF